MTGTYEHSIDGKGRLIIPSRLKEEMGDSFYISPGFDRFLTIYPKSEWEAVCQRAKELTEEEDIDTMEVFFAKSFPCTVDAQNRIVVPSSLREAADLGKDVVIVGANAVARIWNAERWKEKEAQDLSPARMKSVSRKIRL